MSNRSRSRRLLALLASALLVLSVLLGACGGDDEEAADSGGEATEATTSGPLVVGAWGGAYNEATQKFYGKPYEEEGGPALRFVDAPGTQLARLQAQNRADQIQWDLLDSIAAGDAFLANAKGFLEPLPADLKSKFEEILGPEKVSDFGYTMGSLGNVIVCNMDKVDTCPKNMEEFYDPEKFPNDRMMPGFGAIYVATTAMIANGTPPSETQTTPIDLDAVFETLERIRPTVKVFWESGDQQEQVIRSGEVDMAIMWSGRAYRLIKEGVNLKVVWDGGALEPGYMAVVKGAPNKEAAFDFLEWIAEHPEQQAEWAQFLEYSVPNPEALEILPKKTAEQLVDYPANFEKIGVPNWDWYVENADELNQRYSDYLRG